MKLKQQKWYFNIGSSSLCLLSRHNYNKKNTGNEIPERVSNPLSSHNYDIEVPSLKHELHMAQMWEQ